VNRDERRDMTVAELREVQAELTARTAEHANALARQGFQIPPFARYEIMMTTLADMAFGENTRKRVEFEIAVQERWMQLFEPANVERMKGEAMEALARARLLEGVAGADMKPPGEIIRP
jgi:hypothetical protein